MLAAERAVDKQQDDLARAALERALSHQQLQKGFDEQLADQRSEVEALKAALARLEQKLAEAKAKSDLLMAQAKRARVTERARVAQDGSANGSAVATFDRMKHRVMRAQAVNEAHAELSGTSVDDRFAAMQRDDEIDRLLAELKQRKGLPA